MQLDAAAPLTREEELYWIALRLIPGLGTRRAGQLIERYHTARRIFQAPAAELERLGLSGSVARSVASGCTFDDAAVQQEKMLASGVSLISIGDPRYPARLREIFDPPVLLFAKGRLELLQRMMLAVVGTRRPTQYGSTVAERLSGDLARAGLVIASGMARGIDTAAHRGALAAQGDTVAVFGCGADVVYPAENRKLYAEIAERGLVISEFPMGSPAFPQNFPVRNRIVAGMSCGVLVVEGAQYSGSSITAKLALEQGREVFAIPGNITSKVSWGPNLLIKQGAKLVQEWNDVVVELHPEDRAALVAESRRRTEGDDEQASLPMRPSLDQMGPMAEVARKILSVLHVDTPTHVDDLLADLEHYSSSELIAALFDLEMMGLIKQLPGRNFAKVW